MQIAEELCHLPYPHFGRPFAGCLTGDAKSSLRPCHMDNSVHLKENMLFSATR
jgi:hypothetical protein